LGELVQLLHGHLSTGKVELVCKYDWGQFNLKEWHFNIDVYGDYNLRHTFPVNDWYLIECAH